MHTAYHPPKRRSADSLRDLVRAVASEAKKRGQIPVLGICRRQDWKRAIAATFSLDDMKAVDELIRTEVDEVPIIRLIYGRLDPESVIFLLQKEELDCLLAKKKPDGEELCYHLVTSLRQQLPKAAKAVKS